MKRVATILVVLAIVLGAGISVRADVRVRGYYRSNGTYVQPHWRSNPDGDFRNNWSTYPNVNPYTGAVGTKRTPSYSSSPSYRMPSYSPIPSYRTPGSNRSTYPNVNPYTGAVGTKRMPSYSPSPSHGTPSSIWSSPNLWNSRTPSLPSFSTPRYSTFGNRR
jgi:hypothetical protein